MLISKSVLSFVHYKIKTVPMKIFYLLLELACIAVSCVVSAIMYLKGEYNLSSLLILTSLISLTLWVKSNGLLEDKKITNDASPQEAH